MKAFQRWTARELRKLEALRDQGLWKAEIAAKLDRTEKSIQHAIAYYEIACTSRLALWLEVFRRPHSMAEAARAMGKSIHAAKAAKRKLRKAGFRVLPATGSSGRRRRSCCDPESAPDAETLAT